MLWSSENQRICLCIVLCCVTRAAAVIHISGYEGKRVTIDCPYDAGFESHEKYLCRSKCQQDTDTLIKSTEAAKGRYSTADNTQKRIFTVTISHLSFKDAGKYWCGVTKFGPDTYPSEISLKVEKEWCCVKTNMMSGIVGSPVTLSCPYPPQHRDNRKFLCKGDHRDNCTDLVTGGSRFTLQDDVSSSSFLVMVTKLEESDAGTYWCGSDSKWSAGNYTKIELSLEWCCVKTEKMSGTVGHSFVLSCPYPPQHRNNEKFLCKGEHRDNCTDVLLNQSRFTLQEGESFSSFLVKITKLEEGDAGTYWCGSDSKWSAGNYTKIELSVGNSTLKMVVYIAPPGLIVLLLALVIAYKCKWKGTEIKNDKGRTLEALEMISVKPEEPIYKNIHDEAPLDSQDNVYENIPTIKDIFSVYM